MYRLQIYGGCVEVSVRFVTFCLPLRYTPIWSLLHSADPNSHVAIAGSNRAGPQVALATSFALEEGGRISTFRQQISSYVLAQRPQGVQLLVVALRPAMHVGFR